MRETEAVLWASISLASLRASSTGCTSEEKARLNTPSTRPSIRASRLRRTLIAGLLWRGGGGRGACSALEDPTEVSPLHRRSVAARRGHAGRVRAPPKTAGSARQSPLRQAPARRRREARMAGPRRLPAAAERRPAPRPIAALPAGQARGFCRAPQARVPARPATKAQPRTGRLGQWQVAAAALAPPPLPIAASRTARPAGVRTAACDRAATPPVPAIHSPRPQARGGRGRGSQGRQGRDRSA